MIVIWWLMIIFKFQPLMIYADMLQPWAVPCERLESRIANRAALSHGKEIWGVAES